MGVSKVSPDVYEIYMQTEPIPFGRYPKAKYELRLFGRTVYSFVTTCRSPDECIKLMVEKGMSMPRDNKYFYIYQIVSGVKRLVYNESTQRLLQDTMDVYEKEGRTKRAVW